MIVYEIREGNKTTQFATIQEVQAYNPTDQIFDVDVEDVILQKYTIQDVWDMATDYQSKDIDAMGGIYLSNILIRLELSGASSPDNSLNLPYLMITAIEAWTQKIWAKYDDYKLFLNNNIYLESVDYSVVGNIPCTLKDVQWVIDAKYRTKHPDRQVNTDKTYYQNYINS